MGRTQRDGLSRPALQNQRTMLPYPFRVIGRGGCTKRVTIQVVMIAITTLSYAPAGSAHAADSKKGTHDQVRANLKRFDQLDFEAYSERETMKLFREIHCQM